MQNSVIRLQGISGGRREERRVENVCTRKKKIEAGLKEKVIEIGAIYPSITPTATIVCLLSTNMRAASLLTS